MHKQDVKCLKENTLWRDSVLRFWIPSRHRISPCLHTGNVVPFLPQLPWQREMSLPGACSGQGQQDRLEPGETWNLQGCSSQAKAFPSADSAAAKLLERGVQRGLCLETAELPRKGSASSPRVAPNLQLRSGTAISERGTGRERHLRSSTPDSLVVMATASQNLFLNI